MEQTKSKFSVKDLSLYYGDFKALKNINMEIQENEITAFIGPSGCGKSTFLKTVNRMNDLVDGVRIEGNITLDGVIFIRISCHRPAPPGRHGIPAAQSFPHDHL